MPGECSKLAQAVAKGVEMQTVDQIVEEHLKASNRLRKKLRADPAKARDFLIRAGILNKKGTALRGRRGKAK